MLCGAAVLFLVPPKLRLLRRPSWCSLARLAEGFEVHYAGRMGVGWCFGRRNAFTSFSPLTILRNLTELLRSSARVVLRSFTDMGKGNPALILHMHYPPSYTSAGYLSVHRYKKRRGLAPSPRRNTRRVASRAARSYAASLPLDSERTIRNLTTCAGQSNGAGGFLC
jgi:hypothetical protein